MTENPTLRVEVATPPKTPRGPKPDDRLPVPARPALVTASNVATLIGTGAAAVGGPVGWIAGGALALAGAEVTRRSLRHRATRHAQTGTAAFGTPGLAAGRGAGRGGRGTAGTVARGPGSDRAAGRGGRSGTADGPLRRALRRVVGAPGGKDGARAAKPAGRANPGRGANVGRGTAAGAGPTGRGKAAGKGLGATAAKAAKKATAAARRAARAATGKGPGGKQGAKAKHPGANGPCHKTKPAAQPRRTKTTVDRTPDTRRPDIKPAPAPTPGQVLAKGAPAMSNGNGNQTPQQTRGSSVLWQAARRLRETAAAYKPRGMLEVRNEAYEMPLTLSEIAQAMSERAAANSRESLDPALHQLYRSLAETLTAAAAAARQLGPSFDTLHGERVRDLLRGNNPSGWDTANNRR